MAISLDEYDSPHKSIKPGEQECDDDAEILVCYVFHGMPKMESVLDSQIVL